ncbi:MAG: serine hydrolase domain-containing protein [Syntrophothermus sp.]
MNAIGKAASFIYFMFLLLLPASFQAQDFRKLDAWLEDNVNDMGGRAVLMIYKDGGIVYSRAVNDMSLRNKIAGKIIARRSGRESDTRDFTTVTRLPVASCSKWFSAALVMTFVDEGRLKLTDTVGKYLPLLSRRGKGNITLSQCLSHTTGIKAPPLKESIAEMKNVSSMDEAVEQISLLPMEGEPGKVFHYSNTGLQIAGAVIEKISGRSFESLFAERITKPLEMKNTDFGNALVALPAGGAFSTPEDYMKFLIMILNKGSYKGKRILSEKSVEEMQINRISPDVRTAYSPAEAGKAGYGYGEWTHGPLVPGIPVESVSSPGLFGSYPWVNNKNGYCAFLMTFYLKSDGRNERYSELRNLVDSILR